MNLVTNLKKTVVAVALGALAFAGVAGATVSSAVADTPAATVPPQHIDTNHKGTINIHKYANPASGTAGNGNTVTPTTDPVNGVVFTYQKVKDVDLTSNEGWKAAANLKVKVDGDSVTVVNKDTEGTVHTLAEAADFPATSGEGLATKNELDLGVYLIKEKSAPNSVVAKAAPFLVTVPFPNEDAKTKAAKPWLYEVNVYPKNTIVTNDERPHKVINDKENIHFPGDEISWTITQKIPKLAAGETLKKYIFTDELPAAVEEITDDTNIAVTVTNKDGGAVTVNPTKTAGRTVKVEFGAEDLKKLTAGATVKVVLTTKLKADISSAESVTNQSVTTMNDRDYHSVPDGFDPSTHKDPDDPNDDGTNDDGTPKIDPKTTLALADLKIRKENGQNQRLKGAKFKVAPVVGDVANCDAYKKDDAAKGSLFADNAYKLSELVTNDKGIASLKVVDRRNYCVKEIEAPVGYEIDPEYRLVAVDGAVDDDNAFRIENLRYKSGSLPALPVTGASGFIILLLGGSAVIALAVGTGFVATSRRKRNS